MFSKPFCFFLLIIVIISVNSIPVFASDINADLANEAIARSRRKLLDAYKLVLDAERAGVNVTVLALRLTGAGSNLTNAYLFFNAENYEESIKLADECFSIGDNVQTQAELLKFAAPNREITFICNLFGWIFSLIIIVLVSSWSWSFFKKRYLRKISEMKLEARDNGSQRISHLV